MEKREDPPSNTTGGYIQVHGFYRVPDLLSEVDFISYMKANYDVEIKFVKTPVSGSSVKKD